jgi:hypothetical protein
VLFLLVGFETGAHRPLLQASTITRGDVKALMASIEAPVLNSRPRAGG